MNYKLPDNTSIRGVLDLYIRYLCRSYIEEVFAIDTHILLRDLCLFILGIYGMQIFDYLHTLLRKKEVQKILFFVVLFIVVHTLFQ